MRLLHYSKEPLGKLVSRTPDDQLKNEGGTFKPCGLWVSVEGAGDWREWCESEDFGMDRMAFVTEIALRPGANVLRLKNAAEIDRFHDRYKSDDKLSRHREYVQWANVARDYDGIIIAPYCWHRRLEGRASGWYYTWDCASGCIWNADAMTALASERVAETV